MNKQRKWRDKSLAKAVAGAALAAGAAAAQAMTFAFGEDSEWTLDWDTNVAYTAQLRVAKPDSDQFRYKDTGNIEADSRAYAVLINANDGDNNFKRGSLTQNKASFVTEMDLKCHDYGAVRPRARLLRRRVRPEHPAE